MPTLGLFPELIIIRHVDSEYFQLFQSSLFGTFTIFNDFKPFENLKTTVTGLLSKLYGFYLPGQGEQDTS